MKLFLLFLILTNLTYAHDRFDWREDMEAYLRVEYQIPYYAKSLKSKSSDRIDMTFFKEKLEVFSSNARSTNKDLDVARNFLISEYTKLGFRTELHPFATGTNFIAEKKGTREPKKVLILSSHIDSVGNKGANDNGTGTIGVLAVAKELSKNNYPYTIRVLGFDREENGLKGSDAYVATIVDKNSIIGNINFEMMGYHSKNDGGFHVIDCNRKDSIFLAEQMKRSILNLGLDLTVVKTCTTRSDHASFWRHNIGAVVISENFFGGDSDPCYHAKCDVVDNRLNYDYMKNIIEAVLETTEQLLSNN
jgi:Zn-dependent M28 family amino/carboxypeptidase